MAELKTEIAHSLTREEACARLKGLVGRLRARHSSKIDDVDERWRGTSGQFEMRMSGIRARGTVDVFKDTVEVRADLPLAALPFRGMIERSIQTEVKASLERTES